MKVDELRELIEKDSKIDKTKLDEESLNIPRLHFKYYGFYLDELRILKGMDYEHNTLLRFKMEYYTGKSSDQVYIDNPFSLKVQKSDLNIYLNSDGDLQNLRKRMDIQKMKCDYLQDFIKQINIRGFLIRDAISFIQWESGK